MFRFKKIFGRFAVICSLLSAPFVAQSNTIFLNLPAIQGESLDPDHLNWIDVQSFSHSMSRSSNFVMPSHQAINILKRLDKASPKLDLFCNKGTIISIATIEFYKVGDTQNRFYQLQLSNVVVTSVQSSANNGDDLPVENITLTYDSIQWDFTPFGNDGKAGADIITWWNVPLNKGGTGTQVADNDNDGVPDSSDPDDDNDGMTDVYETANGLNPFVNDAAGDLDHDGMSNYDEFVAGTAANNPNSVLRVTRATNVGGSAQITWSSVSGKTYEIYSSTNATGPYAFFSTVSSAGTGETSTTISNSGGQRFFRIRVVP